jgi:hypothetical protein
MTRRFAIASLVALTLLLPTIVRAEYIPPGKEAAILGLFAPYGIDAPADQLGGGAILSEVKIQDASIEVVVTADGKRGSLAITSLADKPMGATGEAVAKSLSFAIWRLGGGDVPAIDAALATLAKVIKKNDQSDFWATNTVEPELPEAAPVSAQSNRSEPPEPDRPYGAMTYLLLGLALLFLGANFPALKATAAGRGYKFWALLVLTLAVGGAARLQTANNVPARKPDATTVSCQDASNCDDGNECTVDICEVGECTHVADASLGVQCCVTDRDCPPSETHCEETFCSLELNVCGTRGTCFGDEERPTAVVTVGEQADLPPSTLATWIFTAAGNDATDIGLLEARDMAVISSTLGLLFLALFLLVSGANSTVVLSATFVAALFPAGLVAAGAGGASGLVSCLLCLSLLAVALVGHGRAEGGTAGWASLGLYVVATGLLGLQRPEFVLFPAIYLLLISFQKPQLRFFLWGATVISIAIAALQFSRLSGSSGLYEAALPFSQSAGLALKTLLVNGQAIPFLLILAALLGTVTAPRGERLLPLLGIVAYLLGYGYAALLAGDALHAVQLATPLAILLAIPAGIGMAWIAKRPSTYAMLCVVILVVYFALFPLVRRNALLTLTVTSAVEQPDRHM